MIRSHLSWQFHRPLSTPHLRAAEPAGSQTLQKVEWLSEYHRVGGYDCERCVSLPELQPGLPSPNRAPASFPDRHLLLQFFSDNPELPNRVNVPLLQILHVYPVIRRNEADWYHLPFSNRHKYRSPHL